MVPLDELPLIRVIPDPNSIKTRMAQLVREQRLLRALLRLSQSKQDALVREQQQACHAGGTTNAA
jgi:hypothetical protein